MRRLCCIMFWCCVVACDDTPTQRAPVVEKKWHSERDTSRISLDSSHVVHLNGIPINDMMYLDQALVQNWKEQYTIVRTLPKAYTLRYEGVPPLKVRNYVAEAIGMAQDTLRETVAGERYGRTYGQLTNAQQAALRATCPILFQALP